MQRPAEGIFNVRWCSPKMIIQLSKDVYCEEVT
jgi:hypothetical protein